MIVALTVVPPGASCGPSPTSATTGADLVARTPVGRGHGPGHRPCDPMLVLAFIEGATERVPHMGAVAADLHAPVRHPDRWTVGRRAESSGRLLCCAGSITSLRCSATVRWVPPAAVARLPESRGGDHRARACDADAASGELLHDGGPATETSRIMNVNRRALAISPAQLPDLYRDPETRRKLWVSSRESSTFQSRRRRRRAVTGSHAARCGGSRGCGWRRPSSCYRAAACSPARRCCFWSRSCTAIVHLVYAVDIYYPRHIVAGHLALAISVLYVVGRGWAGRRDPRGLASRATGDRRRARRFRCPGGVELAAAVLQYLLGEDSAQLTPVLTDVRVRGQRHVLGGRLRREGRRARKLHPESPGDKPPNDLVWPG